MYYYKKLIVWLQKEIFIDADIGKKANAIGYPLASIKLMKGNKKLSAENAQPSVTSGIISRNTEMNDTRAIMKPMWKLMVLFRWRRQ